jgi:vacuolar-type H+-ATPase subunit E/Vma4
MALADLISRLEHEAQDRVRAIHEKADAEVRAIEETTGKMVAEIVSRQFERERAERYLAQQRELAIARRQARARELEAQRAQIARVLNRARTLLREIGASPAYAAAVPRHLDEALSFLEGSQPRVRCRAAFAPLLQAAIDRHDGSQLAIDESIGPGFVAEAGDGSVVVENTLPARLARAEIRLTMALARKLADDDR